MEAGSANSIAKAIIFRVEAQRSNEPSGLEKEVTALFDELRTPLLRYLVSFGLTVHDGEEVVQEVFLSLFLHLRNGKPRFNLRGWVFRVAHNLGLKRREKDQRLLKIVSCAEQDSVESHLDTAPDPEQHMSWVQRRDRLLAVLNVLNEQDQRCLFLRAEGLRYREIAQVLGISIGAVALSLARSLARLNEADAR